MCNIECDFMYRCTLFIIISSTQFLNHSAKADYFELGNKRELFIDKHLIEKLDGVEMRLSTPISRGPIHEFDKPLKKVNKQIMNALKRENYQRNFIIDGLKNADEVCGILWIKAVHREGSDHI